MSNTTQQSTSRTRSLALQEKGKKLIPGLTQLLSKRPDMFAPGVWPGYYSKAKGCEVWDLDGNKYIDMSISGIGANVLGYADPDIDTAVKAVIERGVSSSLNCPEEVELAELLCRLHPWAQMVRYARSGGEAMTVAVRIARAHTGRDKVAFCGYHGWHDWYLAANVGTEDALGEHLIAGLDPRGVPKALAGTAIPFRYNQIDELKAIVTLNRKDLAAIIMEPIRNEPPQDGYFDEIRAIANECGAVFIIDEISSGFRLNTGGAHLKMNIKPDMTVFSKAMGNGYAIAAIMGTEKVMQSAQSTFISSTNWTESIGPAAAIATINKHERLSVGDHLVRIGTSVQNGWNKAAHHHGIPIHVGGIPPLSHFSFETPEPLAVKALFVQLMLDRGFLAGSSFYSMLAHTDHHVSSYLGAVDDVFGEISELVKTGTVKSHLRGAPSTAGFKRLI